MSKTASAWISVEGGDKAAVNLEVGIAGGDTLETGGWGKGIEGGLL
jgi:hypothetical protein